MKYYIEMGVLIMPNEDPELFDEYNNVFNEKYGFFDEDRYSVSVLKEAKADAFEYVKNGVEKTYAIITEGNSYDMEDVVFSIVKFNGNLIENFLER